jgi:signal transduction histidine kinase
MCAKILDDGSFSLTIEDNGRDFSRHAVKKGRGLNNIEARASMIGATAQWSKSEAGANVFELKKA